jgi:hypothetical protein
VRQREDGGRGGGRGEQRSERRSAGRTCTGLRLCSDANAALQACPPGQL